MDLSTTNRIFNDLRASRSFVENMSIGRKENQSDVPHVPDVPQGLFEIQLIKDAIDVEEVFMLDKTGWEIISGEYVKENLYRKSVGYTTYVCTKDAALAIESELQRGGVSLRG